jgi:hypothetical protein
MAASVPKDWGALLLHMTGRMIQSIGIRRLQIHVMASGLLFFIANCD